MPITIRQYERLADKIVKLYEKAEDDMLHALANSLGDDVYSQQWAQRKYAETFAVNVQMREHVARLTKGRREITEQLVQQAYSGGSQAFVDEARQVAHIMGLEHLSPNSVKVLRLLMELDNELSAADRMILRSVNDAYADIIGNVAAQVATGTITVQQAVQRELDMFADKGITEFIDKAGRHWDMGTYSEMATLTAIERATRYGYMDTMQEYGFDLAEISSHYGACPLCEAWEGVIISISGNDHRYPSLADAENGGCFHPRCLHHIFTYYEGISTPGRTSPRPVEPPNTGYSVRMKQRALERGMRKWNRRMAVALTPQAERRAFAYVRMYRSALTNLIDQYNTVTPPDVDYLYRHYQREGQTPTLSNAARKLEPHKIPGTAVK